MFYRQLGNSDLSVSEIALGSWLTYGVAVDARKSRACLTTAFDCGINFIDTVGDGGHTSRKESPRRRFDRLDIALGEREEPLQLQL